MTVQQLIALLANHPSDLRVVVNGYENGFDDVEPERISVERIELDAEEDWWEGCHAAAANRPAGEHGVRVADALVLWRSPRDSG